MPNKGKKLSPKEELFCRYYSRGASFGNATVSYILAYGLKVPIDESGRYKISSKEYQTANTNGPDLLVKAGIRERCAEIINEWVGDEVVDAEVAKVIVQDIDLGAKISAAREYNRVKRRVEDGPAKVEVVIKGFTNGKADN